MATNIIQNSAGTVTIAMPYDRNAGDGVLVGAIFGVALITAASGVSAPILTEGVVTLPKTTGAAWTLGQRLFWDDTNKKVDNTSTLDFCIGAALAAAGSADTTGTVLLMRSTPVST